MTLKILILLDFLLALLFGDEQDDFLEEVAQLFGAAFGIIFLVLAFIFFINQQKHLGFLNLLEGHLQIYLIVWLQ